MVKTAGFSANDVKVLDKAICHQGFLRVCRYTLQHRLYEGGWSEAFTREIMERAPGVGVLLYDPDLDKVLMVEQFRAGCLENRNGPWVLELVAGIVDRNEQPEAVAIREAMEEANQPLHQLLPVSEYYNSPGGSSEKLYIFCARVDTSQAEGVFGLRHEHEDIRTVVLSRCEAEQKVRNGEINNAMSIIALQWLTMNLEEVKARLTRQGEGV